jgi:hypothetical protein
MLTMAAQHARTSSPRRRGPSTPQRFWRMLVSSMAMPRFPGSTSVYWIPAFAGMTTESEATLFRPNVHVAAIVKVRPAS